MNKKIKTAAVDHLLDAILCLQTKEECYNFFEDLCTVNELLSLSQRFEVATMLRDHKTYLEIAEKTGASTATISRVNRSLNYGSDGYELIFERLAAMSNENIHSKEVNKPVFSDHYNSKQYKARKEAATDLENFLMRAKLTQENRDVLNRKLIQVGIEVQEDSSVTVMPDDVWKAKLKTLRPDEIVRVKTGKKYFGEGTKELYDSVRIRVSDRSAPVISVTKTNTAQEEEEEEIVEELSQYEQRVKRRSNAVRNYLYSTFSKSINGQRHGKRRTVVNSYLDDTFNYYKKKAEER